MLTEEQVKGIKEQIVKQIESWSVSEQQKKAAKKQIQEMTAEQLEQFLKQNQAMQKQAQAQAGTSGKEQAKEKIECIFCAICQEKVGAIKIDSNKEALAVLEINPISKGHIIVIPKKHISEVSKFPSVLFTFAKKISKKLKNKMKVPVEMLTSCKLGHCVINLIPIYPDTELDFPRKKAEKQELEKISKKLVKKQAEKTLIKKQKAKKIKEKELEEAPKRIP